MPSVEKILAIVPARGGSKGIPRKNLVDLCGKPLIAWSIETGRALIERGVISRVIVSTDDAEIAEVARCYGGDVPFLRPAELATDSAKAIGYVLHALDTLEMVGNQYGATMLLQPTAPIRNVDAIVAAVERFKCSDSDSLISCYQEDYVSDLVMYVEDGSDRLMPMNPDHNKGIRRQEHGPVMVRGGTLYLTRTSYLRRTQRLVADRPMFMRIPKIEAIDLNSPDDLILLRAMLCGSAS